MLVSIEMPSCLLKKWANGTPGYLSTVGLLYEGWNATIQYYRNEPATFDYAVSNEIYGAGASVSQMHGEELPEAAAEDSF